MVDQLLKRPLDGVDELTADRLVGDLHIGAPLSRLCQRRSAVADRGTRVLSTGGDTRRCGVGVDGLTGLIQHRTARGGDTLSQQGIRNEALLGEGTQPAGNQRRVREEPVDRNDITRQRGSCWRIGVRHVVFTRFR